MLSDVASELESIEAKRVLMHRLALGASWHTDTVKEHYVQIRLNAPFGAQCFLTQAVGSLRGLHQAVLMHLLALCAF